MTARSVGPRARRDEGARLDSRPRPPQLPRGRRRGPGHRPGGRLRGLPDQLRRGQPGGSHHPGCRSAAGRLAGSGDGAGGRRRGGPPDRGVAGPAGPPAGRLLRRAGPGGHGGGRHADHRSGPGGVPPRRLRRHLPRGDPPAGRRSHRRAARPADGGEPGGRPGRPVLGATARRQHGRPDRRRCRRDAGRRLLLPGRGRPCQRRGDRATGQRRPGPAGPVPRRHRGGPRPCTRFT
jgi:hypothetical protein